MISSAVVIPEAPRETSPPARTFKRKSSHSSSRESKRPRVDVDELQYDEPPSRPTPPSESTRSIVHVSNNDSSPTSPVRRKSSLLSGSTATEEKKRNKRLFGSLLGTLSQTMTRPAHKKRDEIEARQRERMRQQTEEEEERRNQRKRELNQRRKEQQKLWDEEAMRQRHQNMRDVAVFLRTTTEPRLYYKPWELRPEEEEDIARQKEAVEQLIRRELGQDDDMDDLLAAPRQPEINEAPVNGDHSIEPHENGDHPERTGSKHEEETTKNGHNHDHGESMDEDGQPLPSIINEADPAQNEEVPTTEVDDLEDRAQPEPEEDSQKDEDPQGEELVEGQEDDVIY